MLFWGFNDVRNEDERMNCNFNEKNAEEFNNFISKSQLMEIQMGGNRFTRISDDGVKFSKLDRFLVTEDFKQLWGDLSVLALDRKFSDHSLLVLRDRVLDFGPRPFRVFDTWLEDNDVDRVIKEAWLKRVNGNMSDCIFLDRLNYVKMRYENGVGTNMGCWI